MEENKEGVPDSVPVKGENKRWQQEYEYGDYEGGEPRIWHCEINYIDGDSIYSTIRM